MPDGGRSRPQTSPDNVWPAGYVGPHRYAGGSSAQEFDDFKVGYDNNDDGDILDAGDDVQIDDDFSSNAMSLSYDSEADQCGRANGNLTADGLFKYAYDAWTRGEDCAETDHAVASDLTS